MSRLYRNVRQDRVSLMGHAAHRTCTLALRERVTYAAETLRRMKKVFSLLVADENFVTLLRAESLTSMPTYLVDSRIPNATEMRTLEPEDVTSRRKWVKIRRVNISRLLCDIPDSLSVDLLNVTVGCRYAQGLLKTPRVKRFIAKHHSDELAELEEIIVEFERQCSIKGDFNSENRY